MQSAAALRATVIGLFDRLARPFDQPLSDPEFDAHARAVFAFQYHNNEPYRAYCDRRLATPERVQHWTEIPPVPTAAFKEVALVCGDKAQAQAVFQTSGTTQGEEKRGTHYVLDLELYHGSLLPNFAAHLLPDGEQPPLLSLIPPSSQVPESSLSHMIYVVAQRLVPRAEYYVDTMFGVDVDRFMRDLEQFETTSTPVLITGTSFAFVHALDELVRRDRRFQLAAGSRLMDTGGFKGRSRVVAPEELRLMYHDRLGIAESQVVNEYGMTELCSQFYDDTLRSGARSKIAPPWVRTRVVDAASLQPVARGETGILQHFDLANLFSVMAIQTEDLGRETDQGFETLGRVEGATPRGCSIAMDLLLEATRHQGS